MKAKYALEAASQIHVDVEELKKLGVQPIFGDYLFEEDGVARHAYHAIAADLLRLGTRKRAGTAAGKRKVRLS
jgi:chorismate-pyruvate lyase